MGEETSPFDDDWWRDAEKRVEAEFRRIQRRARRARRPARRTPRWVKPTVALVAIAGLTATSIYYLGRRGSHRVEAKDEAGRRSDPTVARVTPAAPRIDLADAFRGTPAESFPQGAAGIVLPTARAVGDLSADTVAHDLAETRQLLILSRLDPRMVQDRDPSAFLAALAPSGRAETAKRFGPGSDPLDIATRLAPGSTLLPAAIRVTGSVSYEELRIGQLTVHTKFAFVYPLRPSEPDLVARQQDLLSVVRAEVDFLFVHSDRYRAGDRGVFVAGRRGFEYNVDCAESASGLLSLPRSDSAGRPPPGHHDLRDYYLPTRPMPTKGNCPRG